MNKISGSTFFYKKIFPLIWFGFLAIFVTIGILTGAVKASVMFLVGPIMMSIFGFFLMKKLVWDLMDEVYDGGDYLLVKNNNREDRLYLIDIMNVSASTNINPPRITLKLRKPSRFGDEVAFSPRVGLRLNPFSRNKIADDLILRVDNARLKK